VARPSPAAPAAPAAPEEVGPQRAEAAIEPTIRVVAVIIAVVATVVTAVLELALSAVRVGGVLIGIAIPVAIVANYAISWFAVETTARRWAIGPPAAVWVLFMMVIAGRRTTEGDYLLAGDNWVGLALILFGSVSFAVYAYRMVLRGPSITKM
jgi:hypothetical protein